MINYFLLQIPYLYISTQINFTIKYSMHKRERNKQGVGYIKAAVAMVIDYKGYQSGVLKRYQVTEIKSNAVTTKKGTNYNVEKDIFNDLAFNCFLLDEETNQLQVQ